MQKVKPHSPGSLRSLVAYLEKIPNTFPQLRRLLYTELKSLSGTPPRALSLLKDVDYEGPELQPIYQLFENIHYELKNKATASEVQNEGLWSYFASDLEDALHDFLYDRMAGGKPGSPEAQQAKSLAQAVATKLSEESHKQARTRQEQL